MTDAEYKFAQRRLKRVKTDADYAAFCLDCLAVWAGTPDADAPKASGGAR